MCQAEDLTREMNSICNRRSTPTSYHGKKKPSQEHPDRASDFDNGLEDAQQQASEISEGHVTSVQCSLW